MAEGAGAIQSFYGRWARLYDVVATRWPGVAGWRERAADALALAPGDTVVEFGCGTGANFPYLRRRVGPSGRVVGVDLTPGVLDLAERRVARHGWENVSVVRGDAVRPPVSGPVDAVLGSFVVGLFEDPAVVEGWLELLGPGGRAALLDAASSPRWYAAPVNAAFAAFVWLGAPSDGGRVGSPVAALDRRVAAAHGRLAERTDGGSDRYALGFVVLTAGRL